MKRLLAITAAAVLILSTLTGCGSSGTNTPGTPDTSDTPNESGFPVMEITLAHSAATSHAHHSGAVAFAEKVSELTGGNVTVNIYPASELGDQPALIESCYTGGDVQIVIASQSNMASYMPKLNAFGAPFMFESYDHAHRTMDNYVLGWINEDSAEQMNMHALSMFDYGFRHVTTNGIAVNSAEDMKGLKIRVPSSSVLLATFDSLGSNTQTIAYAELYQSLKQGVVDAEENPVATIMADCLYECQDTLVLTGHLFDGQCLLINQELWDSFSPELKAIFEEAALAGQQVTRDLVSGEEESTIAALQEKGMTVIHPDLQSFVDAMGPVYEQIAQLSGQEELDNMLAAVEANR